MKNFERLYKQHIQDLVKFSFYYVRDLDTAQDVVQEVFLKVWDKKPTLKSVEHEKAYLYKLTKNACLMILRKKQVRQKYQPTKGESISDSPESDFISKEIDDAYKTAVLELPEKCRIIFSMSRFDHLSHKEIAKTLGISVKTVETQIGRAFVFLRKRLSSFLTLLF
ncbi:MAG: RNA polymerase sigma-70 factor [candidate division KSB1 bacterium]|nr:RNA polymerase sigma-70 factor [candidate division KSB1 bacterium]